MRDTQGADTKENEEHIQHELGELLDELRVILPGVQVLFAFLLTVPFTERFPDITTPLLRDVFFATFLCTAAAATLLIAPSAQHRILSPSHSRKRRLRTATQLMIAGTIFLALAITGVAFVLTHVLFGTGVAAVTAGLMAGLAAWLWYIFPLIRRLRE